MLPAVLILLSSLMTLVAPDIIQNGKVPAIQYPIKFAYVNKVQDWSSPEGLAKSIGVPGYSDHEYNFICLTFWTCKNKALDAALLWDNPTHYFGTQKFGTTDQEIRTNLKKRYKEKGVKLMVSAFGATEMPTTEGRSAIDCAVELGQYVKENDLDGVDIDWEDTAAFQQTHFKGEQWLIELTRKLRQILPDKIITHAPQGPYFSALPHYPNQGYLQVDRVVGSQISFYNVQFYNQQTTSYNTSQGLFNMSGGWASETAVNQIVRKGVSMDKIVVGKPAQPKDAYDEVSYMAAGDLNKAIVAAYQHNKWKTGVMYWQFSSDPNSTIIRETLSGLYALLSENTNQQLIKFTCVSRIASQVSDYSLLKSMAVPMSASTPGYNYVSFSSWTYRSGAQGSLLFWVSPDTFLTSSYRGGRTKNEVRTMIKQKYSSQGVKILVNVFSGFEYPTTAGFKAEEVAINLAQFVINFNFDGVDIDYQDSFAFRNGKGEQWLINFTNKLKNLLPTHLIVHTTSAAYFVGQHIWTNEAYLKVNSQVGNLIDFYNVRYFKQGNSAYNTGQSLFNTSSGWATSTSVNELIAKGIKGSKIVVGKPATKADDSFSFMSAEDLSAAIDVEYRSSGWKTGVMLYQFASDVDGDIIKKVVAPLVNL